MASQSKTPWKYNSPEITRDITFVPVFTVTDGKTISIKTCPANEYVSSSTVGLTASSKCKSGYAGTMTWKCGADGKWIEEDDSNCKASTYIDGVPDTYVYVGGAITAALLVFLLI